MGIRWAVVIGIFSVWQGGCGGVTNGGHGTGGAPGASGSGGASGTSGGAGAGATGTGGAASCVGDAPFCPSGCNEMYARPYSVARGCVLPEAVVVGCTSITGGTADLPCIRRRRDGAFFVAFGGSAFRNSGAWAECNESERQIVWNRCPEDPCAEAMVQTLNGCMACADVRTQVATWVAEARAKWNVCSGVADCACVPHSTTCQGECETVVSGEFAAAFAQELEAINRAFCSDPAFTSVCGRSEPLCARCMPACIGGQCVNQSYLP